MISRMTNLNPAAKTTKMIFWTLFPAFSAGFQRSGSPPSQAYFVGCGEDLMSQSMTHITFTASGKGRSGSRGLIV